jgi:hypothetical protein
VSVAAVTSAGTVSIPAGWTKWVQPRNSWVANCRIAVFTATAAGGDAAPAFTAGISGTGAMTCTLLELANANTVVPLDGCGQFQSGPSAGTLSSMATAPTRALTSAGQFAVAAFVQEAAAAGASWADTGSGFADVADDGVTAGVAHTAVDVLGVLALGGSRPADSGAWSPDAAAFGAGVLVTVPPAAWVPAGLAELPAVSWQASGTGAFVSTDLFTPLPGALVVAICTSGNGFQKLAGPDAGLVSDTAPSVWTQLGRQSASGTACAAVFCADAGLAPAARSVTWTTNGMSGDLGVTVRQFLGALPAAQQAGATAAGNSTAWTLGITPTVTGSQIVGGIAEQTSAVVPAPNAATAVYALDTAEGDLSCQFEAVAPSAAGVPVTLGFTNTPGASVNQIVLAEILPLIPGQVSASPASAGTAAAFNAVIPVPVNAPAGVASGTGGAVQATTSGNVNVTAGVTRGTGAVTGASVSTGLVFPGAANTPFIVSLGPPVVMAYFPGALTGNYTQHTVTLKNLPAPGTYFGVDATTGLPNSGAYYNPSGWVELHVANTRITGYDFNGVEMGPVYASGIIVEQCWGHNIDGQNSWLLWTHNQGSFSGLTVQDCLVNGTSTSITGPNGILYCDGAISNIVVQRCHTFNCGSGNVHYTNIVGNGTQPYGNVIQGCYFEAVTDPSGFGEHLEPLSFQGGTGGITVQNNHITGPPGQTASIFCQSETENFGNILITGNLFDGFAQNTIYGCSGGNEGGGYVFIPAAGNEQITGNYWANTGGQNPGGYVIEPSLPDPRIAATGNVYYPSLLPVPGM